MAKKKFNNNNGIVFSTAPDFNFNEEKSEEKSLPANEQFLKIKLDKKQRAGKVVTIISGFVMKEAEIESLAKKLKAFCGTGGSAKNNEIIIQGDNRQKILDLLQKNGFLKAKIQ
jgi:translation initiation factor 1